MQRSNVVSHTFHPDYTISGELGYIRGKLTSCITAANGSLLQLSICSEDAITALISGTSNLLLHSFDDCPASAAFDKVVLEAGRSLKMGCNTDDN
ncbi:hypothetical protein M378DRAFT_155586 [Amanita muscaria Koide BX008]|uniref:Uncharacterized protein n=1 Tax=Amanita muscaria (strain Koide BX008) TaxID=946122 RepID=A0A0C2X8F9_AMAMK|nr:hypothetical protein M378DRAFT_155586 [Amanita muscaria Koide BX008]